SSEAKASIDNKEEKGNLPTGARGTAQNSRGKETQFSGTAKKTFGNFEKGGNYKRYRSAK
ncbi:unnamed protein product, partial [marine sediment metagenome]